MRYLPVLLVWLLPGCTGANLGNPVLADTGAAEARDGYEAALATLESQGYLVAVKDPERRFLRILAKPVPGASPTGTYFDLQAMPGAVGIYLLLPQATAPLPAIVRQYRRQMEQLAWGIGGRARIMGGELSPPTEPPPNMPWVP